MPTRHLLGQTFDARPDRIDFRDIPYRPPLRSLPPSYPSDAAIARSLPLYRKHGMVLDQKNEGACTGFGLAAVVNYARWEAWVAQQPPRKGGRLPLKGRPAAVSPRMLYQNARLYDEWQGEDYEGSSCRGAMKGFHKHGVCLEASWPYREADGSLGASRPTWTADAAQCPLGAYYRVDARSLVDMQAAIAEVHAIFVSGLVHEGWKLASQSSIEDATIRARARPRAVGGHAYSIVGYHPEGFVVQNSWGPDWGFHGFAILPYEEWVNHGQDAWVLALGAPMLASSPPTRTDLSLERREASQAPLLARGLATRQEFGVSPWLKGQEAMRCIFVGHEGRANRALVEANDANDGIRRVVADVVDRATRQATPRAIAIYAHGGLNDREAGVTRARVMGPWLERNGIYPIFVVWQTGFLESAADILRIALDRLGPEARPQRVEGWLLDRLIEMKNRAFEVTAREIGVKAIWENMKSRALDASRPEGAMTVLAETLRSSFAALEAAGKPAPSIHLLGHSAGAILLGAFLARMKEARLKAGSVHLWAPACSVDFAVDTYGAAFGDGTVDPATTHVDVLSDDNEVSDPCVPVAYSKSLLYLVSRSLEVRHKTPVLGLQKAWRTWRPAEKDDFFARTDRDRRDGLGAWDAVSGAVAVHVVDASEVATAMEGTRRDTIRANHGSFDNNLDVVNAALGRVLGAPPEVAVTNLKGF
jgi:hypothetical protein